MRPSSKSANNTNPSPIIVKLNSAYDRSRLFVAVARYLKSSRKALTRRNIGIDSDEKIFVHECLTKKNREIMQLATQLKRQKRLVSVFSIRGQIYAKTCRQ